MISLIICCRKSDITKTLRNNIAETVGIEFEIILIDNSQNKYSIFSAYNEGVRRAKFPYLCFMHEDIIYHTNEWGKRVVEHLKSPNTGIIGVAGSHFVAKLPGSHWSTGITSYNILQNIEGERRIDSWRYLNNNDTSIKATLVDGLWFCISQNVMKNVFFDDKTFSGYHCYDSDICLQMLKMNYEVRIIFDIFIEHFSLGIRDKVWLQNLFLFFNKWKHELPKSVLELSKYQISEANFRNAKELVEQLKINGFGWTDVLKIWYYYIRINFPSNRRNLRYLKSLIKISLY